MGRGEGFGKWAAVALALCLAAAGAGPAHAQCRVCGSEMFCMAADGGAYLCLGNGEACVMGGRCRPGGPGPYLGDDAALLQVTVLEDAPGSGATGLARVVRGAGPLAVGRHAQRIARAPAGGPAAEPAIVFSAVGFGEGVTAAFRSRFGDGFTLRRDADGRGATVTVAALRAGRPGPALARERLGEDDALAVRVRLDGRPRLLVVQAATLPREEAEAREAEARRALRGANGARPGVHGPPFELQVVAD